MTKKSIKNNLTILRGLRERARGNVSSATLQKINNVIELYEDRKISQSGTAENLIRGLTTGNKKELEKGMKQYEKAVEKYQDATPIGERENVKKATEKANEARKAGAITRRLKKEIGEDELKRVSDKVTKAFRKKVLENRKIYSVKYMLFTSQDSRPKSAFRWNGTPYYVILNPSVRVANIKVQKWIEEMVKVKVIKFKEEDKALFKRMIITLRTDPEFRKMTNTEFYNYIDAIRIESVEEIDEDVAEYDIFEEELTDGKHNVSIFHSYIQTELNPDCVTLKEALTRGQDIPNECWINTLRDHYADTLMKQKRGSLAKNMTREKILQIINKSDEDFKRWGASITQMNNVFKEFNIQARIYDIDSNLIYKHDPVNFNCKNYITFNGLVKNGHIYTLNHNLNSLKRRESGDEPYKFRIGNNYYINNREEPLKYKMIDGIDDVVKLKDEEEYRLVLKDNDLDKAIYEMKKAGYEPQIRHNAGRTVEIKFNLTHKIGKKQKTVAYSIVTQHLDQDRINDDVWVDTEEKYNKVSATMFKFHKSIFSENYKSYYNEIDLKVLDECRTIVPNGTLLKAKDYDEKGYELTLWPEYKCSIDTRKAYSYQATKITHIPVFKEFDVWKPYTEKDDFNRFNNYTLYVVRACQGNIFFNKKDNLVYGKHLKELMRRGVVMKILCYKIPSYIHKVKYKKAVEDLYKTVISDDKFENPKVLKNIANIAFGLLEKSYNKKTVSRIFDNLKEALQHQKKYDGRIYVMNEIEYEE